MSFNEATVNRDTSGQFAEKRGTAAEISLDEPKPVGPPAYRYYGAAEQDPKFAEAETYAAVDEIWKRETEGIGYMEKLALTDAAVERSRVLREEAGVPRTPTMLKRTGIFASPFANAENDVELYHQFSMLTEEPPGDGEASRSQVNRWMNSLYEAHDKRRNELVRAGVVSGQDTISE